MPLFLDLPQELIIRILSSLLLSDLTTCRRICRSLHAIIADSVLLQYRIATQAACVEDNPNCFSTISEKLDLLIHRELAWLRLRTDFTQIIPIKHNPSGIYDLTGGVYLLGDASRLTLHYCTLPSVESDETSWTRLDIGRSIVDMGLAVLEHDLIAVVTTVPDESNSELFSLEILLLKLSTGEPHPLAQHTNIFVSRTQWPRPAIGIEIVGDHLALVTTHFNNPWRPHDRFYVYEWKTGKLKLETTAENHSYSGVLFLSTEIICLPNTRDGNLEFWRIPSSAQEAGKPPLTHLIRRVSLPRLIPGRTAFSISCRGEPNPAAHNAFTNSSQAFHYSDSDSIMIFNIRMHPGEFHAGASFTFIIHRRSLLNLCPADLSAAPDALNPDIADPAIIDALPWSEWGPSTTRWFNTDAIPTRWITTSAGQRCVIIPEEATIEDCPITVLDFNPYTVKRMIRYLEERPGLNTDMWYVTDPDMIAPTGIFEEPVNSRLPYIARRSEEGFMFDGVLMDEERILGIRTDLLDRIVSVEVLHFG